MQFMSHTKIGHLTLSRELGGNKLPTEKLGKENERKLRNSPLLHKEPSRKRYQRSFPFDS